MSVAGETGLQALGRARDWSTTALGPVETWPRSLSSVADLVHRSPLGMVVLWGPELIQIYNDGYAEICGARHPEALGQPTRQCWPEVWDFNAPIYAAVMNGETRSFAEQGLTLERHGRSEDAWFDLTYSPLCDDAGRVAGVLVTVVETTTRVLADRRHAAERARHRAQFEQAPGFVCVLSGPEHVYDFGNRAYARLVGREDFVGKTVREALPDIAGQGFYELLDAVYATGVPHAAERCPVRIQRTPDGPLEERFLDFIYQPVLDEHGQVIGVFTQGHDVTETHIAQMALSDSEARLRALNQDLEHRVAERTREHMRLWDVSPDLLGILGPDAIFETSNPAWRTVLDWTAAEIATTSIFDLLHPDDVEATRGGFARTLAGEPAIHVENRYRHRDGSYRWISWVGVPEDRKIFCNGRDVTTEKAQAAELLKAQDRARQGQKSEAIGQLTGGVAHDFNNLLTIIRSSVDFLRRTDLPEARRSRYVEAISDTVTRATALTAQLLAFARRQPLTPSTFEVTAQIRSVVEMVRPLMGSRIEVFCDFEDGGSFACVDVSQFETALVNLAVNARDAMGGEGRLSFCVRGVSLLPEIRGHVSAQGEFIAVSITDTGSGISRALIDSIFDPFFTTKEVGKGTGLGLSQVFGFAKQSGGEIDVDSEEGRGTTFTLYLPRVAAPGEAVATGDRVSGGELKGQGLNILLVEDNAAVGAFTTEMLVDLGHSPRWVGSASAALALLDENDLAFDVVFSDVMMPGMTGLEMAKLIRVRHPGLPVLLTSGYSEVIAREGQHGFDLLQKPYSVGSLSRLLRKAIVRSDASQPDIV